MARTCTEKLYHGQELNRSVGWLAQSDLRNGCMRSTGSPIMASRERAAAASLFVQRGSHVDQLLHGIQE